MSKKHHIILYALLGLTVMTAALFGVDASIRANAAQQTLEDAYTRHVLEAQEQLQAMSIGLAKIQAAAEVRTQVELLSAVSRQAEGVAADLTALPLSHAAMGDTVRFCQQLSEYTLGLALLRAAGSGLGDEDAAQLQTLRNHCTLLLGQLATAYGSMQQQGLVMAGGGSVFYEPAALQQRPVEQVADPDHGMEYPRMVYDGAFSDARRTGTPRGLGRTQITQEQAVEAARQYLGQQRVASAVPGVPAGGVLPAFGVTLTLNDGLVINAEVTQQGGQVLWMMPEHAEFQPGLTLEECTQAAQTFLQQHGYAPMEANDYQVYDGMAVIHFAALQDGVVLYPDQLKLQVRMDTGEVVGVEANQYLMNHTQRENLAPVISRQEALAAVSPRLEAQGVRLCVIPLGDDERLCYEITGVWQQQTFMVYIDAATGEEVQVLMMVDSPEGPLAA